MQEEMCYNARSAAVAQLVEQLIRNEQVTGSTPASGSISCYNRLSGRFFLFCSVGLFTGDIEVDVVDFWIVLVDEKVGFLVGVLY